MPLYEQSQPYGRWMPSRPQQPYYPESNLSPVRQRPPVYEETLAAKSVQVERKYFELFLKENDRGRLLRITEKTGDKRSSIIIPASGLQQFKEVLDEMVRAANEAPASPETPA